MKLVQEIKQNHLLSSSWGIYELNEEEANKYGNGNKFALSQGVFSDFALNEMGVDKLLSELKPHYYEGFFETQKEAYMQVKLVEMKSKIDMLENTIEDLTKVVNIETPTWI